MASTTSGSDDSSSMVEVNFTKVYDAAVTHRTAYFFMVRFVRAEQALEWKPCVANAIARRGQHKISPWPPLIDPWWSFLIGTNWSILTTTNQCTYVRNSLLTNAGRTLLWARYPVRLISRYLTLMTSR